MLHAIRERATVQAGGLLALRHPELPDGTLVDVVIMLESSASIEEIKDRNAPRPFGLAKDRSIPLPDEFFEPLPAELITAFNGEG